MTIIYCVWMVQSAPGILSRAVDDPAFSDEILDATATELAHDGRLRARR